MRCHRVWSYIWALSWFLSSQIYNLQNIKVHLTPQIFFFAKTIKLILWSNVPQIYFDLVKSSNFCAPLKPSFVWFMTEHGESGESKAVTSLRERKLWLPQSGLLLCLSIEAFLPHKFFVGAPQSTDFCFYQQYLLLRRILKWALTQKTPKFIISLKRMRTHTHQHRKVNS